MNIILRPALPADWTAIAHLLSQHQLPLEGAEAHLSHFWVALQNEQLAGVAGIEPYGAVGLLRSVVVAHPQQGLGTFLVNSLLSHARTQGLTQLILLTTTAADFFPRFGFHIIERSQVPLAVQVSAEFQGACPASAIVMQLNL